ncbi:Cytochrome P450 89A9 [Cocos nucifera]|uniref:Cytochrome P450 89A9 n=1 Tax=Cocos nucifera TaxID=13894 RepID=A0A8K0IK13_COCNU|nr:Cytochrome P450 89A9 [Cocos nucifera]
MDIWLLMLLSLSFATAVGLLLRHATKKRRLPPGPPAVPIIGNLFWLRRSVQDEEIILRELHGRYGRIVTLHIGSRPLIFISDRTLAHQALVEHGATFSDRVPRLHATRFLSRDHIISAAAYGPLWRLLRRNLISEILHSSRVKLYAHGRAWVLQVLTNPLRSQAASNYAGAVTAVESFQFAMFCLLVLMCFGEKLDEKAIKDIEIAQKSLLLYSSKLDVLAIAPRISRYIFRDRLKTALHMRQREAELFVP